MYDRAKTILGSSGFEHVFVGECCKKGEVIMDNGDADQTILMMTLAMTMTMEMMMRVTTTVL